MTAKELNRQEFVIVGWSDLEATPPHLEALLLSYHTNDGKLLRRPCGHWDAVKCLRICCAAWTRWPTTSPLSVPPPRSTRFDSPLVLSRVYWVEPKLVAEITYLTRTADNLLRHTEKPATDVGRQAAASIG